MTRNIVTAFVCCLLFPLLTFSQQNALYKEVDDFVLHVPIKVATVYDLKTLQREIKNKFKEEDKLVRAAYTWITNNISYDCAGYTTGRGLFSLPEVIAQKKSICEGYAVLFKDFCDAFDLKCKIIHGYVPDNNLSKLDTGFSFPNHAWNIVAVNGSWKFIEATWGSGGCNSSYSAFIKSFYEMYFFMPPEEMIKMHFPQEKEWQLLARPYSFAAFKDSFNYRAKQDEPYIVKDSIINKKVGDTIRFYYHSKKDTLNTISITSDNNRKIYVFAKTVPFDKGYYYDYTITDAGRYFIYVSYFNDKKIVNSTMEGTNMETYLLRVAAEKIKPAKNSKHK
jgi:hypothetical protein